MDAAGANALLPAGLRDVLAPDAAHEAATLDQLVEVFSMHGYQRVEPPLVEFETTLLNEGGHALTEHMFRVMDPVSQRMMAVRADMTLQVARIASTRLAKEPRPLRLSYGGQVLRVRGSQLRPERQFTEAGIELIGADGAAADAEAIVLAAEALDAVRRRRLHDRPQLAGDRRRRDVDSRLAGASHVGAARGARPQGWRRGGPPDR